MQEESELLITMVDADVAAHCPPAPTPSATHTHTGCFLAAGSHQLEAVHVCACIFVKTGAFSRHVV